MNASFVNTGEESDGSSETKSTGIVFFVLNYDDLLAPSPFVLPPLAQEGAACFIGRASSPGPPRLDASDAENKTLLLADALISRKHARFFRLDGVDYVEDLGSKHGTFVDGEPIFGATRLLDRQLVEMGHSLFVYRHLESSIAARSVVQRDGLRLGPTNTFCPELMTITHALRRIAPEKESVLILGETGTGKEIAASFVHEKSQRRGLLVCVDCGAIPPQLVEGELFGHKRGAFSGATESRKGRLRSAEGGTVFLDEIGNLPETAQATLLRVIQEREVVPIGADRPEPLDVRFIAATNANIVDVASRFRADLRSRLSGLVVMLPPLRQRREDLGVLTSFLLKKAGASRASMTRRAARLWLGGELRGNVRELEMTLSSAVKLAGDGPIDLEHLGVFVAAKGRAPEPPKVEHAVVEEDDVPERKRHKKPSFAVIEAALVRAGRVQAEAARILGVSDRQMARWMDAYHIPRGRKGSDDDPLP